MTCFSTLVRYLTLYLLKRGVKIRAKNNFWYPNSSCVAANDKHKLVLTNFFYRVKPTIIITITICR